MKFVPCVDRNACTEDGSHCRACGRSHDEIAQVRKTCADLAQFIHDMGYDNPEEFVGYVAAKVLKRIKHTKRIH